MVGGGVVVVEGSVYVGGGIVVGGGAVVVEGSVYAGGGAVVVGGGVVVVLAHVDPFQYVPEGHA